MEDLAILAKGAGYKLFFFFIGMEVALWYLRRLDRRLGLDWRKVVDGFEGGGSGAGAYLGLRIAGLLLAVAILLS